jgi:5-oxoprolinase (ATP-hydrolysing)
VEDLALGFVAVANEAMCQPIRSLTEARGHKVSSHNLAAYGGAGGQHACGIAESLGISRVIIHKNSSILSAYGIALADVVREAQEPVQAAYSEDTLASIQDRAARLRELASADLRREGFTDQDLDSEIFLNMRYEGSDTILIVGEPSGYVDFDTTFRNMHRQEFGFVLEDRAILVDDIRVRVTGNNRSRQSQGTGLSAQVEAAKAKRVALPRATERPRVYFAGGWLETSCYLLNELETGAKIQGPAIVFDSTQTILVHPNSVCLVLNEHLVVEVGDSVEAPVSSTEVEPIQLSLFGQKFIGIAEHMGRVLQKTAISVNIKER